VQWLEGRLPRATDLRVSELSGPGTTGFSNDTLMFELAWKEDGRKRCERLVLRIQPTGMRVFPEYDLGLQFRVMQSLAGTNVPVPRMFWKEDDPDIFGAPFYIMQRIDGRIPDDNPPYHGGGWMTEIAPEERTAIWWSGVETLAQIHKLDWRALGLLPEPSPGVTPLAQQLAYYEHYLAWVSQHGHYPVSEAGLEWLKKHRPAGPEPTVLCWGDSRLGNMIFREGRCVAVLDWEMVTLGNPAQDVAWWLFFDEHHSAGCELPRLSGIPGREETIDRYQMWSGIELEHLDYYDVFAATRFSVIMARLGQQMKSYGVLPAESDFDANNTCTRMLAARLKRAG
jgi:aminoglycoside phosphotransferase (APT) family kinase protein